MSPCMLDQETYNIFTSYYCYASSGALHCGMPFVAMLVTIAELLILTTLQLQLYLLL